MTYRRTWFSCVLWFVYTVLCIVLIAADGEAWIQYLAGINNITPVIIYGLFVIPVAALYWIIRGIAIWIGKRCVRKNHTALILECIVFLLIMAIALLIRIMCLNYAAAEFGVYGSLGMNKLPEESMKYYDMAVVTENGFAPPVDYGLSDLYVMLLSIVLSFLGNKPVSAVFLQIILQMVGMILVYASTRKLAGRLPACAAVLCLACSKACIDMLVYFKPEWFFFVTYMIGMLISVSFVKSYCANRIPKPLAVIGAIAIGALIGGLTYLDLTAASLLIVIMIVAVGKKNRQEDMPVRNSAGISAVVMSAAYLACAVVWFGAMDTVSIIKGTDLSGDIWYRVGVCLENSYFFTGRRPYTYDIYMIGALIVPASFLMFEYFRSGKEQNYMPWILMCLLAAPTPLAVYGEHGHGVLSLYIWAVLAGVGLQNCVYGGRTKVVQAVIEEINTAAEKAEETERFNQNSGTETAAGNQEKKTMEHQTVKPNYIENPLPLPKKHEKREMDYQYHVEEEDMKYDLEVPLNDDFDVK